jgi:xanthine dehydrogenase YagS FAD-binding subunit
MKNFTYYRPKSAAGAVKLLDARWGSSELLAGGTDLLSLQKENIAQPVKVISLSDLPAAFTTIAVARGGATIGAGAKLARIAEDKALQGYFPALTSAAGEIAGPQIRNMGTLGGSLCQRNRCWYFRDEHVNCLLKGGDKCFALDGENRYHAVFTRGHKCVIVSPSTLGPVLIALGATARVLGPEGERTIEMAKFFRAPNAPGQREHVLAPNDVLLSVSISRSAANSKNASYEVKQKLSSDWPLVQAAVAFEVDAGKAKNVKVVLGHVAPTPHIAEAAAKAVEGKEVTEMVAAAAGEKAAEGSKPLSQNAYKLKLVAVAVKRALLSAAGARKYWEV